jgi:hypothetical protein
VVALADDHEEKDGRLRHRGGRDAAAAAAARGGGGGGGARGRRRACDLRRALAPAVALHRREAVITRSEKR